ncbi:hypothetical protein VZT92_017879 [Zoarces viviparus]
MPGPLRLHHMPVHSACICLLPEPAGLLGDASGLWNMCRGGGTDKHVMTAQSTVPASRVPNSLYPWAVCNHPICAELTAGSETQL